MSSIVALESCLIPPKTPHPLIYEEAIPTKIGFDVIISWILSPVVIFGKYHVDLIAKNVSEGNDFFEFSPELLIFCSGTRESKMATEIEL
jgi:hypothetical protein